jgi:hypothetical protein
MNLKQRSQCIPDTCGHRLWIAGCGRNQARCVSFRCPYLFAAVCEITQQLLGTLAEFRKATLRFFMPCHVI